jgi:Na+/H+-translocating membrane pyrophosphatase
MVFLRREYQILLVFVLAVFALLGLFIRGATAMAFLGGAVCAMLVGVTLSGVLLPLFMANPRRRLG